MQSIYDENEMDPPTVEPPEGPQRTIEVGGSEADVEPQTFVMFEQGQVEEQQLHEAEVIKKRRAEREETALAQRYAGYARSSPSPVTFEQFVQVVRGAGE